MAQQDVIKRQFLIIEFLKKRPATFKEINDFLEEKQEGTGLSCNDEPTDFSERSRGDFKLMGH